MLVQNMQHYFTHPPPEATVGRRDELWHLITLFCSLNKSVNISDHISAVNAKRFTKDTRHNCHASVMTTPRTSAVEVFLHISLAKCIFHAV